MQATFTKMSESTAQDWQIIMPEQLAFFKKLPDRILSHMALLSGDYGGFAADRLRHSLQTAYRAAEAGEDDEYSVCALLHDIGDTLGSANHADVGAAILQPFISEENRWMTSIMQFFRLITFSIFSAPTVICTINIVIAIISNVQLNLLLSMMTRPLIHQCQYSRCHCLSRYCGGYWQSQ